VEGSHGQQPPSTLHYLDSSVKTKINCIILHFYLHLTPPHTPSTQLILVVFSNLPTPLLPAQKSPVLGAPGERRVCLCATCCETLCFDTIVFSRGFHIRGWPNCVRARKEKFPEQYSYPGGSAHYLRRLKSLFLCGSSRIEQMLQIYK